MTAARIDPATVPGWGVDADPENDPTYPMRDQTQQEERGLNWTRPPLQRSGPEVLQSIEYLKRPAVFGTSSPPSGLSGVIRRQAFVFSESQWAHWLLLMLADRVNMVEGVLDDLARGQPPNLVKEYGLNASLKHNRAAVISTATVVGVAAVGAATFLLTRDKRDSA